MESQYGSWQGRNVLFIGDSLTARRLYPETVKRILGINVFYHCKGGASLKSMVDGDAGRGGDYDNITDAKGVLYPLCADDVSGKDLIVFFGGYNGRNIEIGQVGDRYSPGKPKTVAGLMQYAIDRIYEELENAGNMTCRLLIVTVDRSGRYPYVDASAMEPVVPGTNKTLAEIARIQREVAEENAIPVCDLFHHSGINEHTWAVFGKEPTPVKEEYSPFLLDATGTPVSDERIRYETGKTYYQIRDGKPVAEKYELPYPYPYNGDQLHKSPAGYERIGEVIAGAIVSAYGN